jgi:hypothetical protein
MAQTNYTPIQLYYSTTAAAVPTSGNLLDGELAINITDGKLYYKNNSGVVTLLASTSGASGDVVGPASATDTAIALFDGTTGKLIKNSPVTIGTTGNTVISGTDNSNAMLRITQLGTGNALLVEDTTNPDATPFVIDASGNVLVGTTASITNGVVATAPVFQEHGLTNNSSSIGLTNWSSTAARTPSVNFNRSAGNTVGTRGGITTSGTGIGAISFSGDDGTNWLEAARIESQLDATGSTNDMPGRLVFSTTADGASSPTERMRIDNAGRIRFNGTPSAGTGFTNSIALTGATTSYSTVIDGAVQSDATSGVAYVRVSANTASNGGTPYTVTNLRLFQARQGTLNADSTVTNQYGFIADSDITGATNNYGFYGNIASGANRWNLYMAGTADNYFAGNVGVGTTTPTSLLQTTGSSSESAFKTPNIAEVDTITATAATGTINYDITTQSVLFYTTNASGNWTLNFRGSSGTSLNTLMQTGECISATFLVTQGATAYYNSAVTIDGTSVTPKWQGGTAPTSGNASSVDCYTYVIQKTGSATYAVLASQTKFA